MRARQLCGMHKMRRRELYTLLFAAAFAATGCGAKHVVRASPPSVSTPPPQEESLPVPEPPAPPPAQTKTEEPAPEAPPLEPLPPAPAKRPAPRPLPAQPDPADPHSSHPPHYRISAALPLLD